MTTRKDDSKLEQAFRPALWASLVFVLTMLAIYLAAGWVSSQYEAPTTDPVTSER